MNAPLSERFRPKTFEEIVGQEHLLNPNAPLLSSIRKKTPLSFILFGPPGSGKTSLARLYAKAFNLPFKTLSAIFSGISDIKEIIKGVEENPLFQQSMILFVDEIHRFNKAQQDAFLPYIEKGTLILIGATAENPSFTLNDALLSRLRVLTLNPLNKKALKKLIDRYESDIAPLPMTQEGKELLIALSQGDGRYLMNLIEEIETLPNEIKLNEETLKEHLQRRAPLFDKGGDQHYNLISVLHKSVRTSDPNASLYWFARMLEGGEDPLYIARRLIRMATEDIGLADPQALSVAINARKAYEIQGSPEGELALAEAVVYLSLAPKSNSIYTAYKKARLKAKETNHLPPPKHTLNAPTKMMKELGYGKNYIYDHDLEEKCSGQNSFPDELPPVSFYEPVPLGFERELKKRFDYFEKFRKKH